MPACLSVCLSIYVCVCVERLNRRKTSLAAHFYIFLIKAGGPGGSVTNETPPLTRENVPAGLWWCTWAHLSRSWWPPQSHIYMYIYIYNIVLLHVLGFSSRRITLMIQFFSSVCVWVYVLYVYSLNDFSKELTADFRTVFRSRTSAGSMGQLGR